MYIQVDQVLQNVAAVSVNTSRFNFGPMQYYFVACEIGGPTACLSNLNHQNFTFERIKTKQPVYSPLVNNIKILPFNFD